MPRGHRRGPRPRPAAQAGQQEAAGEADGPAQLVPGQRGAGGGRRQGGGGGRGKHVRRRPQETPQGDRDNPHGGTTLTGLSPRHVQCRRRSLDKCIAPSLTPRPSILPRPPQAQSEKKKKLVNPLFFVSAHRLSVRNLSKSVTDAQLRALCAKAVASGLAKGLVGAQDQDAHLTALGTPFSQKTAAALALPLFVDNKGVVAKLKHTGKGDKPTAGTIKSAKVRSRPPSKPLSRPLSKPHLNPYLGPYLNPT